jgi:hypothetical protein
MCHKGQQPLIDEPIVCYVHPQGEEVLYPTRGSPKDNILSKWRTLAYCISRETTLIFFIDIENMFSDFSACTVLEDIG